MRPVRALVLILLLVCFTWLAVLAVVFWTTPTHRGDETHFDTLIVLGSPATLRGTISPEMRPRVDEAVREYRAGVASHIIFTGGAAYNRFVEGQVMADDAASKGVPRSAIFVEGQATDTIQNIWFSHKIMEANGWHSAEVISSPYHLPRTALILEHCKGPLAFDWRTHAAPWTPPATSANKAVMVLRQIFGIGKIALRGFPSSMPYLPR